MLKSQILLQHVATMPLLIQLRNISLLSLVGFPLRCALKTNQKTILAGHVGGLSATPAGPSPSCHGLRIVHDLGQRRTCCAAPRLWGERHGQLQASCLHGCADRLLVCLWLRQPHNWMYLCNLIHFPSLFHMSLTTNRDCPCIDGQKVKTLARWRRSK